MSRNFGFNGPDQDKRPRVWPLFVVGFVAICVIQAATFLPHP
jgi:uncharacterized membrane protein YadS